MLEIKCQAQSAEHGGAPRAFSRGRKKGTAREGERGRRASTMTSLLFNHKAEPALSPKVRVFSEENNGFGGTTGKICFREKMGLGKFG